MSLVIVWSKYINDSNGLSYKICATATVVYSFDYMKAKAKKKSNIKYIFNKFRSL